MCLIYFLGETISFYDLMLRARTLKEIVIGYKLIDQGIIINPEDKHKKLLSTEYIESVVFLATQVEN